VLGWKALVLESSDLAATTTSLVAHGVETVCADQPISADRRSTMIRDPEGNLINVFGPLLKAA
jgi:glyoxylase I family protein